MGLEPRICVPQVCRRVAEPKGPRSSHVKIIGPPVRGQRGIEGVRKQYGIVPAICDGKGLVCEWSGAARFAGVRPATCQRTREAGTGKGFVRTGIRSVEAYGQRSRRQFVLLAAGEAQYRRYFVVKITVARSNVRRLAVQDRRFYAMPGGTLCLSSRQQRDGGNRVSRHDLIVSGRRGRDDDPSRSRRTDAVGC